MGTEVMCHFLFRPINSYPACSPTLCLQEFLRRHKLEMSETLWACAPNNCAYHKPPLPPFTWDHPSQLTWVRSKLPLCICHWVWVYLLQQFSNLSWIHWHNAWWLRTQALKSVTPLQSVWRWEVSCSESPFPPSVCFEYQIRKIQ